MGKILVFKIVTLLCGHIHYVMMGTEDKTLFCFCHWGKRNKVLPDGSISYGGGITDQVTAETGIKYNAFVNAVFDRLGIDPSDKMLHFTVKFDRPELIRLRDQEGVDTLLQFNDGYAHVYASSLEKEPYSRPPPGGKKPLIACYARRPKQSQSGGQDMPLKSNINKPFDQRELPNQGTSKTTAAVSAGFPPTQTGSRQGPEICSTNFMCNAQLSNLNHHKYTQPTSSAMQETFWTQCPSCKIRFKYYCTYLNRTLRCRKCSKIFTACNLGCGPKWSQPGGQDVPLKCNLNQPSELPNQEKVDCRSRKRFRKQIVESSETNDTSNGVETEDGNKPPCGLETQLDGYDARRSSQHWLHVSNNEDVPVDENDLAILLKKARSNQSAGDSTLHIEPASLPFNPVKVEHTHEF